MSDPVNHPSHYTAGKIEVIDFIEDQAFPYHLGNAIKYICRAGKKNPDKLVEDLQKAVWYINRYIDHVAEREPVQQTPPEKTGAQRKDGELMNYSIHTFENPQFGRIRAVVIDGQPWFNAYDVCKALGLPDMKAALKWLDEDEITFFESTDSRSGEPKKRRAVSASGVYTLIRGSCKSDAKNFKSWFTHTVLPALVSGKQESAAATECTDCNRCDAYEELLLDFQRRARDLDGRVKTLEERFNAMESEEDEDDGEDEEDTPESDDAAGIVAKSLYDFVEALTDMLDF